MRALLYISVAMLLLASCDRRQPKACVEASAVTTEVDVVLSMENCSEKASFYRWDFGNGSGSESESPKTSYQALGDFDVTLYAYSANGFNIDSSTVQIQVRNRYLDRVVISSIDFQQSNGMQWDGDGSGPDVKMRFRPNSTLFWDFETETTLNIEEGDLPLTFEYSADDVLIESNNWVFELLEETSTFTLPMYDGTAELKESTENPVVLEEGDYRIEIWWELRY